MSRFRGAVLVTLGAALAVAGCEEARPTHELTYEVSGKATAAGEVTVDPPGEQKDNAVVHTRVPLPWKLTRTSGYGFARVAATTGAKAIRCRILDASGTVLAEDASAAGGRVECRASVQDG